MIAKLIAHASTRARGARPARRRPQRDRGRRRHDEPSVPPLLVSHPVVRAGHATTAFLTEHPPLSALPLHVTAAPFRAPWRLNLPHRLPRRRPTSTSSHSAPTVAHGASSVTAPMPGTVIRVEVASGRRDPGTTASRRARGDEDGDPGALAVRRHGQGRARRQPATVSPAARCSSSSRASRWRTGGEPPRARATRYRQ